MDRAAPSPPALLESCKSTRAAHAVSAPASTRGLVVVTFNIGARADDMFSSEAKRPQFMMMLFEQLNQLCKEADIICLQECSPAWSETVMAFTPPPWKHAAFLPDATLLTIWNGRRVRQVPGTKVTALKLFPDRISSNKSWRECLAVVLELVDIDDSIITVVNAHVIDGKDHRRIQGRELFTTHALQGAAFAAIRFRKGLATTQASIGLAATQASPRLATTQAAKFRSFVVMGDFNMKRDRAITALRIMPECEDNLACAGEEKNDFIVSNVRLKPLPPGPEAYDKVHKATRAHLDLPRVDEPRLLPEPRVYAPGATWGTAASGSGASGSRDVVMGDLDWVRARARASQILQTLYQSAGQHKQCEEAKQEQAEQAETCKEEQAEAEEQPEQQEVQSPFEAGPVAATPVTTTTVTMDSIRNTTTVYVYYYDVYYYYHYDYCYYYHQQLQ